MEGGAGVEGQAISRDGGLNLLGYGRVSTREQEDSGLGLAAQFTGVESACGQRGWNLIDWRTEMAGFDDPKPVLESCKQDVLAPDIDGLIVRHLDRIGRSVHVTAKLIDDAVRQGWAFISLNPNVDMSTLYGVAMAQMACVFSQLERGMIVLRTREAIQAKMARGEYHGRAPLIDPAALLRAVELYEGGGMSWRGIARQMDAEGFRTPGKSLSWHHETVSKAVGRYYRFGLDVAAGKKEVA